MALVGGKPGGQGQVEGGGGSRARWQHCWQMQHFSHPATPSLHSIQVASAQHWWTRRPATAPSLAPPSLSLCCGGTPALPTRPPAGTAAKTIRCPVSLAAGRGPRVMGASRAGLGCPHRLPSTQAPSPACAQATIASLASTPPLWSTSGGWGKVMRAAQRTCPRRLAPSRSFLRSVRLVLCACPCCCPQLRPGSGHQDWWAAGGVGWPNLAAGPPGAAPLRLLACHSRIHAPPPCSRARQRQPDGGAQSPAGGVPAAGRRRRPGCRRQCALWRPLGRPCGPHAAAGLQEPRPACRLTPDLVP